MFDELKEVAKQTAQQQRELQQKISRRQMAHINLPIEGGGNIQVVFNIWDDQRRLNQTFGRFLFLKKQFEGLKENEPELE